MNKLVSTLLAGAAALALSGGAFAADEAARDTGKDAQNQTQGASVDQAGKDVNTDGREAGRDATEGQAAGTANEAEGQAAGTANEAEGQAAGTVKEGGEDVTAEGRDPVKQEYEAELKQCDSLSDSQKLTCTDAAKKKHGQM